MPGVLKTQIIRSGRKTLALQVLPNATLIVKAPILLPQREIDKFIEHHRDWIEKRVEALGKTKVGPREYKDGEEFLYLGKVYKLKIGDFKEIVFEGDYLLFPQFLVFRIEKELERWYVNQAKRVILQQVDYFAKEIGTTYKGLTFSDTRSQWGSCTQDNRLQFSWRLVMAPILVVNYVIIHELVHTKEKHHQRSFWSKVRLYTPSYRQQIKWLKLNANRMVL